MAKKLPIAPMERILKESTAGIRVSREAAEELAMLLEEEAKAMARDAAEFASHAQRKTILRNDIILLRKMRK